MRRILLYIFIYVNYFAAFGQEKYWVLFDGKDLNSSPAISEKCKENRILLGLSPNQLSDLPVSKQYISELQNIDIEVLNKSRWLNGVSAKLTNAQISKLKNLSYIKAIIPIDSKIQIAKIDKNHKDELRVDYVMKQIGIEGFLHSDLTGKGITIGVIDAGFYGTNDSPPLSHLFKENKILSVRDYINPQKTNHFEIQETYSDFHGTEVLAAITGKDLKDNVQLGAATDATFYLARTDSGNREFRGEEDNWVAAMEWMDSLGVRLINTSLGYAKGFTNPKENYKPEQMDGKTSLISKAAQIAIEEKGMTIVVSAGNEGDDKDWKIVSTPADVEGIIAVGATNDAGLKMGYSSIGPDFLQYVKPDVSCFSLFGTSLAAPVITGFVACLMQSNPKLTNKQIKKILEESSNLYPYGNNFVGYGVPNASKALSLSMGNEIDRKVRKIEVNEGEKTIEVAVPQNEELVIFNKKNSFVVVSQDTQKSKYNLIQLKRNSQVKQTTIVCRNELIEVFWK